MYKVIAASSTAYLQEKVNAKLSDGWELVGGISFDYIHNVYLQAMFRRIIPKIDL